MIKVFFFFYLFEITRINIFICICNRLIDKCQENNPKKLSLKSDLRFFGHRVEEKKTDPRIEGEEENGSCGMGKEGAQMEERARVGSCRVAWKKREDWKNRVTPVEDEEDRDGRTLEQRQWCIFTSKFQLCRREGKRKRKRKSEARKTILVHISYRCIIGGKERRGAKRHGKG